jgi:hypothetical protein
MCGKCGLCFIFFVVRSLEGRIWRQVYHDLTPTTTIRHKSPGLVQRRSHFIFAHPGWTHPGPPPRAVCTPALACGPSWSAGQGASVPREQFCHCQVTFHEPCINPSVCYRGEKFGHTTAIRDMTRKVAGSPRAMGESTSSHARARQPHVNLHCTICLSGKLDKSCGETLTLLPHSAGCSSTPGSLTGAGVSGTTGCLRGNWRASIQTPTKISTTGATY